MVMCTTLTVQRSDISLAPGTKRCSVGKTMKVQSAYGKQVQGLCGNMMFCVCEATPHLLKELVCTRDILGASNNNTYHVHT